MKGLAIREAISDSNNAMSYMKSVEKQFLGTSKSLASTLMIKMITMKYGVHSSVREHIIKTSDMASQLKEMDMINSEGFIVHFIIVKPFPLSSTSEGTPHRAETC